MESTQNSFKKLSIPKLITIAILTFILNYTCIAQNLIIQSNNSNDEKDISEIINKSVEINQIANKLFSIIQKTDYSNTKIQIVFFDPQTIGQIKLKQINPINSESYRKEWNVIYENSYRILMFFHKSEEKYIFENIEITDKLSEEKLLPIVSKYIQDEIMKKESDLISTIYAGLNALKNAFDPYFRDRLVEGAQNQIHEKKYYKGTTYIEFYWFNFITKHDRNLSQNDLDTRLLISDSENNLRPYMSGNKQLKLWNLLEHGTSLDSWLIDLIYLDKSVPISLLESEGFKAPYNFNYIVLNHDSVTSYCEKQTSTTVLSPPNLYSYSVANSILLPQINNSNYLFIKGEYSSQTGWKCEFSEETERYQYTLNLYYGKVTQGEMYSNFKGEYVYPLFTNNQATWCNAFASDLYEYVYGSINGNRVIPIGKNANGLNDFFNSNSKSYFQIYEDPWDFINRGYPVIFSKWEQKGIGHIEVGYPDPYDNSNYVNEGKNTYWNNNAVFNRNDQINKICVGAGSHVGYKTHDYGRKWANEAQKFLYLDYLKIEYNH